MIVRGLILLFCFCYCNLFGQKRIVNSIGLELVWIDTGNFTLGDFQPPYPVPQDTVKSLPHALTMWMGEGRGFNEAEFRLAKELAVRDSSSGFDIRISKPFYIGVTEVTQGQWKKVMGANPARFQNAPGADSLPVENVSWKDAKRFIRKLNRLENTHTYRLPSEFEWEYAARAGTRKDIPWAQIEASANLNKTTTIKVASKMPNAWGLYDVLGNVWEWVEDYYNGKIFADSVPAGKGRQHVLKGASFVGDVKNATYMTHAAGPGNGYDVGFRIVKDPQ